MIIEQIYTGCLSQGAYYIHSNGEAAIIDPLREIKPYIEKAAKDGVKIKYIFETHFHADFVSGHVTLAENTGAPIIYGPNANPSFEAHIAKDGDIFKLGDVTISVLHTPGHTMESTTYLLADKNGKNHSIFTGDTLFLGDVGRPDLAQKSDDLTIEDLASYSYDSLRNKIMPLSDDVIVYPAHGAGSACGKNMMKETVDTLGNQKKVNYALRDDMTKEEFIKEITEGLLPPPDYFPKNVKLNKEGYRSIDEVIDSGLKELSPFDFEKITNQEGALMLDVRKPHEYAESHIPNSIFIGLDGSFAPWAGELIVDLDQPIVLICPDDREEEAITRLSRLGFDNTKGFLKGGLNAWINSGKEIDSVFSISADDFNDIYIEKENKIFDVRKKSEFLSQHINNAYNTPLSEINSCLSEYPKTEKFYVHCAGGYRSMIASSILKSRGFHNLVDIKGGYKAIEKTSVSRSEYICPSLI